MGKLTRAGSAAMVIMVTFNIFIGLAAAAIVEPPDVSNSKSGAYTISCPNYAISEIYQGDISSGTDVDWYKCSVNSGDKVVPDIDANAYYNYVAIYEEDSSGNLVGRLSLKYGDVGSWFVPTPPVYFKILNENAQTYYGYQFLIARNLP